MDDGLTKYLMEAIGAAMILAWGIVSRHFGKRLDRVEEACGVQQDGLHNLEGDMKSHVDKKVGEITKMLENRRLETKADVRELHKKIEGGHGEILRELKKR